MFDFTYQKKRSMLFSNIRSYFTEKDYLEVATPTLSPYLIPEPTIKVFSTLFSNEFVGEREFFLIPSPELYMKEMLASGSGSVFQISECFRNSEQLGDVHNPEFTMLEYYTVGADDSDSIALTIDMIRKTAIEEQKWLKNEPLILTVEEAMWRWAHTDLIKAQDISFLREEAERLNLYVPEDESWEDTFNRIFITYVEPGLPKDREVYLRDYPKQIDCLAKDYPDRPYKKRWEMYIDGTEIANCYDEETDTARIKAYYKKEQKRLEDERRNTPDVISPSSPVFPNLVIPQSSGVAIGLDRLLMVNLGLKEIAPLLAFPMCELLGE